MKHSRLNRYLVLQQILEKTGCTDLKPVRVDRNGEMVARAMRAGDRLVIILEEARRVVGFNLFRNNQTQRERAKRYTTAFLKEQKVLWKGGQL